MSKRLTLAWLLLLVPLLVTGLASCTNPKASEGDSLPTDVDEDVIYSPYVNSSIVLGEGIESSDIASVRNAYFKRIGKEIAVKNADSEAAAHEIVIGKTDREVSQKAYRRLVLANFKEDEVGFSIYSDGKSVAIAFDEAVLGEDIAFTEALDYFVSRYMTGSTLKLNDGNSYITSFDPINRQKERDTAEIERLWNLKYSQILAKVNNDETKAKSILEELKLTYVAYGDTGETVAWIANLYDPISGGFYYSNSARNNVGFAADLDSTAQALGIVESLLEGYGGTITDYFGEKIAAQFVSFVNGMQDENGYFYHPQWSRELLDATPARKEIDVINAVTILDTFGASPIYDTPNGVKGTGVQVASALTLPLSDSGVKAMSELVSSESEQIYIPAHLKSKDAFLDYLATFDTTIKTDPASVCKQLTSELPFYLLVDENLADQMADYRICNLLKDYLDGKQNYSGYWSNTVNSFSERIGELIGFIKIYNTINASVPRFENVYKIILKELFFEKDPETMNNISDAWTALYLLMNNIKSFGYETSEAAAERCVTSVYDNMSSLIKFTREKLVLFVRTSSSFSTMLTGSASESYGMSVAIPLSDEGDINGTLLAVKSIWYSIFGVIGMGHVPLFNTSDRMVFQQTLLDMGVIIKNEVNKTSAEDFENYEVGEEGPYTIGWRVSTDKTQYTDVVSVDEKRGNVIRFYASSNARPVYLLMGTMSTVRSASCYSYEFDARINEEVSSGLFAHIVVHPDMQIIGLERVGDNVRILECSGKWSDAYNYDTGARAKVGEWFNLRVEYYPGTAETLRVKIYFNGECVSVSNMYYSKHSVNVVPSNDFGGIAIYNMQKYEVSMLFDNIVVESSYRTYEAETSDILGYNIDQSSDKQTINNFDSDTDGSIPKGFVVGGDAQDTTVVTDQNANKLLSISEKAGEIILPLDQRGIGTNSALIEFDFTIDPNSAVGTKYQINFNEYLYKSRTFGAMQLIVSEENGKKYASLAEVTTSGKTGNIYSSTSISLGVKYTLRLQLFYKEGTMVVSIGDSAENLNIVGLNLNILKESYKYYMGEATIEALTPTLKSTIFIDNLVAERIISDFETSTTPEVPRKEYTFDETADMTLSGVRPSGGELSFGGAANNAFVEIPVNKRVNVSTLAIINLDVKSTNESLGEVIIKMTDTNGNVVAAISLVKSNGGVDIHEYTENGRYPTPIYTVSYSSFTLTIKYSEQRGGYNIFVDGVYATSSSLLYSKDSQGYKFEKLNISCPYAVGLAIDNLYTEEVCANMITSSSASSDSDVKNGVLTYENSSFVSKPTAVGTSFPTVGPALSIREGVFESTVAGGVEKSVSKVLEYYSNGDSCLIYFTRTHTLENANAAVFETDLMIQSVGGKMQAKIEFCSYTSDLSVVYDVSLTTEGPGQPMVLTNKDFTVTLNEEITEGKWFKFRMEYTDTPYDYNYDGYNDYIVRVFVNGVQVGEEIKSSKKVIPAADMNRVRCAVYSGYEGSMLFDNTILGQCNMEYEAAVLADTDVLYFNPDIVTHQTQFTFGKSTSTAKISKYPTVADEANKVLEFYTSKGSADKLNIAVTKEDPEANAIMFETDIIINSESDLATFYLSPRTSKDKYPFRLTIEATKDGSVTISGDDIAKTVIGNTGEFIHLRIEYMNPMIDYTGDNLYDILVKIYVGDSDEAVAIGYKPYSTGSYHAPLDLVNYVLESPSETVATVIFDNVKFWQVTLTPDESEHTGDSDESTLGGTVGGGYDDNGWS